MHVFLGVKHASKELVLETSASQDEVLASLAGAHEHDITLADDKGRKVFIPAGSLAYAELGEATPRRVGFGV